MSKTFHIQGVNWDARAWARLEDHINRITRIYNEVIRESARIAVSVKGINPDRPFTFDDYPRAKKQVQQLFNDMAAKMQLVITSGTVEAWALANAKNDALIDFMFQSTGIDKSILESRYQFGARNEAALSAFQNRKIDGLGLSDRVWKSTEQARKEMELAIDVALRDGRSAENMSRDIRQLLNDPDRLFRRVRDKRGNLVLSEAAKAFHPGQGVYRSSYKNAMRVARTEVNMAYREADHARWSRLDFVVGIEIRLSNNPNHCPMCKTLAGKYPKGFKFRGWHPQCRCFAVPILTTDDEFDRLDLMLLNGEDPGAFKSVNEVTGVPADFRKWIEDNGGKIAQARSIPYWIRDNFKNGDVSSWLNFLAGLAGEDGSGTGPVIHLDQFIKGKEPTNAEMRNVFKKVAEQRPDLFSRGLDAFRFTSSAKYLMQHSMYFQGNKWVSGSTVSVSTHTTASGFNPADELKGAFAAMKEGRKMTFNQEYAIESMWHEILHARTKSQPARLTNSQLRAMETANQFSARHTYDELLALFGVKPTHKTDILDKGIGYSTWIKNFRDELKKKGISEKEALRKIWPVLMSDYTKLEKVLRDLLNGE